MASGVDESYPVHYTHGDSGWGVSDAELQKKRTEIDEAYIALD